MTERSLAPEPEALADFLPSNRLAPQAQTASAWQVLLTLEGLLLLIQVCIPVQFVDSGLNLSACFSHKHCGANLYEVR